MTDAQYSGGGWGPQGAGSSPVPPQPQSPPPTGSQVGQGPGFLSWNINNPWSFPRGQWPAGVNQQPYQPTRNDRPPREWGTPDYVLRGAQGYPGVAPWPMPQPNELPGLVHNLTQELGRYGPQGVAMPMIRAGQAFGRLNAMNSLIAQNPKEYAAGLDWRIKHERDVAALEMMKANDEIQKHVRAYSEDYEEWGPSEDGTYKGESGKLYDGLMAHARELNDQHMMHLLETDPAAAERYARWLDGRGQDLLKTLQIKEAQDKVDAAEADKKMRQTFGLPTAQGGSPDAQAQQPTDSDQPVAQPVMPPLPPSDNNSPIPDEGTGSAASAAAPSDAAAQPTQAPQPVQLAQADTGTMSDAPPPGAERLAQAGQPGWVGQPERGIPVLGGGGRKPTPITAGPTAAPATHEGPFTPRPTTQAPPAPQPTQAPTTAPQPRVAQPPTPHRIPRPILRDPNDPRWLKPLIQPPARLEPRDPDAIPTPNLDRTVRWSDYKIRNLDQIAALNHKTPRQMQLDIDEMARRQYDTAQRPYIGGVGADRTYNEGMNRVVQDRVNQMAEYNDRLLAAIGMDMAALRPNDPDYDQRNELNATSIKRLTDRIGESHPKMAAQAFNILMGNSPLQTGGYAANSKYWQQLTGLVFRVSPHFNANKYALNQKTQNAFGSGTAYPALVRLAADRTMAHSIALLAAAQALNGITGPMIRWNHFEQYFRKEFGDPRITRYDQMRDAVITELAKVFKPQLAEGDINRMMAFLSAESSPAQKAAAFKTIAILLMGQMQALAGLWNANTGQNITGADLMTPYSRQAYRRLMELDGSFQPDLELWGYGALQGWKPGFTDPSPDKVVNGQPVWVNPDKSEVIETVPPDPVLPPEPAAAPNFTIEGGSQ